MHNPCNYLTKVNFSELLSIRNNTLSHQNAPSYTHGYAYTAFLINYYPCIATNNMPNRCHRHCSKPYTPLPLCTLQTPAIIISTQTITTLLPNICITNATISPKPHHYTHRLTGGCASLLTTTSLTGGAYCTLSLLLAAQQGVLDCRGYQPQASYLYQSIIVHC
jgi:hypothetical protein